MPWFGTLAEVSARITTLRTRKAGAEVLLTEATLDDAARAKLDQERAVEVARRNALPTKKTRGDGSQYWKYADGHIVEITDDANSVVQDTAS